MEGLSAFDSQLFSAIVTAVANNGLLAAFAIAVAYINWNGLIWWTCGVLVARARGWGRRGLWGALTVYVGLVDAWLVAELLKLVVRRPRPFRVVLDLPPTLITEPSSFSFPSGDAAFAFGAAVALGRVAPAWRLPALLFAVAVAFDRVAVGVHYPLDVLAGALIGTISGLTAPVAVALLRRRVRWRAFVVPHTHWDREWYERFEGYRARLVPMVSKLLELLERDTGFRSFTFDGHTIWAEDYLEKRPGDRSRIEALVRAERLFIGPWYVLADNLLVSGESLVRNFQEGLRVSASFGRAMRVGYVADPFGHPAQTPQLLRGFGYSSYVFSRGVGDEGERVGAEFRWQGPSGDSVLATHLVDHYSGGLQLVGDPAETPEQLRARVRGRLGRMLDVTTAYANGSTLLFMVGDDHVDAYARLPEAVRAWDELLPNVDARIANLEEYEAAMTQPRGLVVGEMVRGRYRPILRGVNSARVWIKQENVACERLLLERCEPLDALTGGAAREEVRSLWRTLLQNHPHDSICGCSIDDVHDIDMAPRFARVRSDGEALAARLERELVGPGNAPIVWSAVPWERDAVVALNGRFTRVHCAAYGTAPARRLDGAGVSSPEDGIIENEALRVEVALDGSFFVVDRASGERSGPHGALLDEGDRGDEYTYSYAGPTLGSRDLAGRRTAAVDGDRATVTVEFELRLPSGLREDRLARAPDLVPCAVRAEISLDAGARRVDVRLIVDNQARDHRLRVLCETGTRTLTHRAGAAFAWLDRETRVSPRSGWIEQPTAERAVHDLVAVEGATRGLAIGVDGLREYAVLHDGRTIAITLLRAVGWLSRGDLPERKGHAGPALTTPSAQCIGEREYRYCVVPLGADVTLPHAAREIRGWLSPARVAQGDAVPRSFYSVEGDVPVQPSALRAGPDGAIVARLFNPSREPASATLRFARPALEARAVDLREGDQALGNTGLDIVRTATPPDVESGVVAIRLAPYEIGTYLVRLA
ncbi:MAG TPA: phosphatase PAP2 family protein [Candidatus Limnocylindria bacterium]|nr:phosphatase PAP2 family protein [Candidatus Limnocylindria bacterium]